MAVDASKGAPLRVLIMPDAREANPYQALLAEAIVATGAEVRFSKGYRRVLPIWRSLADCQPVEIDIVHLHWPNSYLRDRSRAGQLFYMGKFLADLAASRYLQGTRIVWTVHNHLAHESPFPDLELRFRQQLARQTDRLILHNRATAETIAADYQFPLAKASVIPHGHYRSVYAPAISQVEARKTVGAAFRGAHVLVFGAAAAL